MAEASGMRLEDYQKPIWRCSQTILELHLDHDKTTVQANLHVESDAANPQDLVLDGEALTLVTVAVNGEPLRADQYRVDEHSLTIFALTSPAVVSTEVHIAPRHNTALSGLYSSGDNLCTQCESRGFRRITYSVDRPDVLSVYQVTLTANPDHFPLLLANGDKITETTLEDGRLQATFLDPAPKPSYLFAIVAGDFVSLTETYTATNGREHLLAIHLPKQYPLAQAQVAMNALRQAMHWDEVTYGCFYDLDAYHVVAMPDFNFGAMENKGLNIFNTSALLADPAVATDASHLRVHTVVGHEYFHNWTGNRVTVRDWFQISLKEGLTTYREMCFAMATYGPIARLDYIFDLVERQFAEDSGPSAHELLPKCAHSIENLYTATTYTKGAEVLRMLEDLLGHEKAVAAVKAYLAKFDGQAATIQDFLAVVAETAGMDMTGFLAWYHQKGTPKVRVSQVYDAEKKTLAVTCQQQAARQDLQAAYKPLMMPVCIKLWDHKGQAVAVSHPDAVTQADGGGVLRLEKPEETFVFTGIEAEPVVSAFRGLSAPVLVEQEMSQQARSVLMCHEEDLYTRYHQAKTIWLEAYHNEGVLDEEVAAAIDTILAQALENPEAVDVVLRLPDVVYCQETVGGYDFDRLSAAHEATENTIAKRWQAQWEQILAAVNQELGGPYVWTPEKVALRQLRAHAIKNLVRADGKFLDKAEVLYRHADNITDQMAALSAMVQTSSPKTDVVLQDFYEKAKGHDLQLNRWFWLQTGRSSQDPLHQLQNILQHEACDWRRPNRVMNTFAGWLTQHSSSVHCQSGKGYQFLAEAIIKLDAMNPSTASRLMKPLMRWRCYDDSRQELLQKALQGIQAQAKSQNVQEKVMQALGQEAS